MKVTSLILIMVFISSCFSVKKSGTNKSKNEDFILQQCMDLERQGKFTESPLIIIDAIPFDKQDYIENYHTLRKSDIKEIDYLEKDSQVAQDVYGERAKGGVLLVTTFRYQSVKDNNKTLFLYDNEQITSDDFDQLNPDDIEELEVIKDKNAIKKITDKNYDKIIIITSKK